MDILNNDCHSLVFKWLTLKEKARYERVCLRWKKLMYRYQNEIKLCELIGRNNEPLYNDNAFLVSILTKINENIEKIDLRSVESVGRVESEVTTMSKSSRCCCISP